MTQTKNPRLRYSPWTSLPSVMVNATLPPMALLKTMAHQELADEVAVEVVEVAAVITEGLRMVRFYQDLSYPGCTLCMQNLTRPLSLPRP